MATIPPFYNPFTVHKNDLATAVNRLLAAATPENRTYDYENPATGWKAKGWRPRLTNRPGLYNTWPSAASSLKAIVTLWQEIDALKDGDVKPCCNLYQPLIADFVLLISGKSLRIEHKHGLFEETKTHHVFHHNMTNVARKSPFSPSRQWH